MNHGEKESNSFLVPPFVITQCRQPQIKVSFSITRINVFQERDCGFPLGGMAAPDTPVEDTVQGHDA